MASWLADQLSEERGLLEARHRTLCDSLRVVRLDISADYPVFIPPTIMPTPFVGEGRGSIEDGKVGDSAFDATLKLHPRAMKGISPRHLGDDRLPREESEPTGQTVESLPWMCANHACDSAATASEAAAVGLTTDSKFASETPKVYVQDVSFDDESPLPVGAEARSKKPSSLRSNHHGSPISHSASVIRIVESEEKRNMLEKMVTSHAFEITFALLIVLNAAVIATEMQHDSYYILSNLQSDIANVTKGDKESWADAMLMFDVFEIAFGCIFMLEVFLKIVAEGYRFLYCGWNIFDTVVVTVWFVDHLSLISASMILNPMILRLCRLARLIRLLRLVRMVEFFDTLTLMISSIRASVTVLVWGTILLLMVMMVCAMSFNSIISTYIADESLNSTLRLELFEYFGSFSRCMVTMFELTLGNWVPVCRLLLENIGEWLGLCVLCYELSVSFAVVRVISGIFLHETFKCASMDDELMIKTQNRAKKRFTSKMRQLFHEMDTENSGLVCVDQFKDIIGDARVQGWLLAMELNIKEPERVFSYLVGNESCRADLLTGNEVLHADELVSGMARLRGNAREFDLLTLMAESHEVRREFEVREQEHEEVRRLLVELCTDVSALRRTAAI